MSDLISLKARRGQLKGQLTRFSTYVNKESVDIFEIKCRSKKMEELWSEFDQVQSDIESFADETDDYRIEFEEIYFSAMALGENLLQRASTKKDDNGGQKSTTTVHNTAHTMYCSANSCCSGATAAMKLAPIDVPKFSGAYEEWSAFHDIYIAMIHNNPGIDEIQRFFHLRSCLKDEAAQVIMYIETTAANYNVAWSSVVARYNNKKVLVQSHTKELFDIPAINEEAGQLRKLIDQLNGHISALETLGEKPKEWGSILLHLIATKLDSSTLKAWETVSPKNEIPKVQVLLEFLKKKFKIIEAVETSSNINVRNDEKLKNNIISVKKAKNNHKSIAFPTFSGMKCYNCQLAHSIYKCPSFLALPIPERIKRVGELKLCKICIRTHIGKKCDGKKCFQCHKAHNTLLHLKINKTESNIASEQYEDNSEEIPTAGNVSVSAHASAISCRQVLLSTAIINVYNNDGKPVKSRVLLDSGSQNNFITEHMAQVLKLRRKKVTFDVAGIGHTLHTIKSEITVMVGSCITDFKANISCLIIPCITNNIPIRAVNTESIKIPNNIILADKSYNKPQQTKLGWIVAGPVFNNKSNLKETQNICLSTYQVDDNLDERIAKFWRLENIDKNTNYTLEEKACYDHFIKTVRRDETGKFIVRLPFREDISKLGNSYKNAFRRFLSIEKRLGLNTKLNKDYQQFMYEYQDLGHMEPLRSAGEESVNEPGYFLPHHAVVNDNSSTTRLRVVFDGSSKTDTGISLNNVLLKGPTIQDDLLNILARFRTYKYAISADISKMYRQIWIAPEHRKYQQIFWRENKEQPMQIFQLNTVTYGTVSASFLATACLYKLAEDEYSNFPEACTAIKNDFYMDDYLGGANTKEMAVKLRNDLRTVLQSGGFNLRKWSANDSVLLQNLNKENNDSMLVLELEDEMAKVLGVLWHPRKDIFQYKVRDTKSETQSTTKRSILAQMASLFDPLGLVGPIIIKAKILMQEMWRLKIDWDKPVPTKMHDEWTKYLHELASLRELCIPRFLCTEDNCDIEVHGFADASLAAYGACIYVRTTNNSGVCTSHLLCAKSKVAPLKVISLPRLELCAAVILVRLYNKVIPKLGIKIQRRYFWSDSSIVLAWVTSPSTRWQTFVAYRVGEIHDLSSINEWHHIGTKDNPADIISRGCSAKEIINSSIWWHGPSWLTNDHANWPKTVCELKYTGIPEEKGTQKTAAFLAQPPFLESGIIRVGGRIKNARHVEIAQRHPILIPKNSTIARLILLNEHDRLLHAGPQAMLANSRLKYWIIGGRNIARHVFHQCVKCFRLRPKIVEPIMADLPTERLEPNRPFKKCGVDYAGPIAIKTSLRRNAAVLKGYICVFICFSTRAVHIELVTDLTTEAFLNALKRFIARRGVCSDIFSDNATNFVGANNRLLDLKKIFHSEEHLTKIYDALSTEGIRWHFIPPRSPHFGGLWEASIKSIKNHLYRVLGTANLTYDELNTILIRIEAVLNSRPLTPCYSDPTDTTPLTPAHFLIGEPTCSIPEPDLTGIPDNCLKRWQRVTQLTQALWQRWNKEYLSQLQTRRKWLANKGPKIKVGTIVLVKEDEAPPDVVVHGTSCPRPGW
ncbi:uncharacterized protein LOC132925818 [Rhopalosiphum padi]|uniref:uncharacterized protein LOC132925818 n=1 Tax=Rhopalosiphum padi TaxID=40932 RepID=UPI00298D8262|nr:uncharacterized protein LOC132925818 [Rhopalosiphum padi]